MGYSLTMQAVDLLAICRTIAAAAGALGYHPAVIPAKAPQIAAYRLLIVSPHNLPATPFRSLAPRFWGFSQIGADIDAASYIPQAFPRAAPVPANKCPQNLGELPHGMAWGRACPIGYAPVMRRKRQGIVSRSHGARRRMS